MAKIKVLSFSQLGKSIVAKRLADKSKKRKFQKTVIVSKSKKSKKKKQKHFLQGLPSVDNSHFKNYKSYCKSLYFKRLRKAVLKKANYICVKCKGRAKTAHHEKYRNRWSDGKIEDCIAVCNLCHAEIHIGKPVTLINRTKVTAINTKESKTLDELFSKFA